MASAPVADPATLLVGAGAAELGLRPPPSAPLGPTAEAFASLLELLRLRVVEPVLPLPAADIAGAAQEALRREVAATAAALGLREARLTAYGVTPASTFAAFLRPIVEAGNVPGEGSFFVAGSSEGWIAFYAAFLMPLPVLGVEALQSRVDAAQEAAAAACASTGLQMPVFLTGDAATVNMWDAAVLWDNLAFGGPGSKRYDVIERAFQQSVHNVVVVSYQELDLSALSHPVELLHSDVLPNSWTPSQRYYAYRRSDWEARRRRRLQRLLRSGGAADGEPPPAPRLVWAPAADVEAVAAAHVSLRHPAAKPLDEAAERRQVAAALERGAGTAPGTIAAFL
mmetsp:Transcript_17887/g.60812  ORF Transcript_17887/g.60812 Transcript_17887/m.60812 type:complete len:340 (+) Transcript_17887:162-1181(+)